MKRVVRLLLAVVFIIVPLSIASSGSLREKYLEVNPLNSEEFRAIMDDSIIIDVRSSYAFKVARIKNAYNIPLINLDKSKIQNLVKQNIDKKFIVFYCHNTSCGMSFNAAQIAMNYYGYKNVYAFEEGITGFLLNYPDLCLYLDKTVDYNSLKLYFEARNGLKSKVINDDDFAQKIKQGYKVFDFSEDKPASTVTGTNSLIYVFSQLEGGNELVLPQENFILVDKNSNDLYWLEDYLKKYKKSDYYYLNINK